MYNARIYAYKARIYAYNARIYAYNARIYAYNGFTREILDPCVRQLRDRMQESLQVIACRNRS